MCIHAGAGLCLAMACDIRITSLSAKLGLTFVTLGIHPGMASSHFLPQLIGPQAAKKMLLTGETITGSGVCTLHHTSASYWYTLVVHALSVHLCTCVLQHILCSRLYACLCLCCAMHYTVQHTSKCYMLHCTSYMQVHAYKDRVSVCTMFMHVHVSIL
jgi:Enoyl-CoA hydratase/isomerase